MIDVRAGLEASAEQIEAGIRATRDRLAVSHPDFPPEQITDTNGRPLLAELYASLAHVYVALAAIDRTPH